MSVEGWEKKAIQYLASDVHHSFIDGDWIEAPYIINEGIRLIQTGNIGVGKFIDRNKKYISESSFVELRCKEVYSGDILICRLADPIGRSCIVPPLEEKAITSVDICILRIDKQRYDKWFISHSLNQQSFLDICQKVAGGSTRQRISRSNLGKIEIDIPQSKAEQTQIATILSTIDRAIEQTEALIAKQQRIKTGLMQDLLTKGIDENGNIRSEETHEFKDSPLGRIPVEWEVKEIGKVASLQRGYDIREIDFLPGNFPVIASSGIIGFHKFRTSIGPNVVVGRKGSIGNVYYIGLDFWAHDTSLFVTNFFGNHERYIYYLFVYLELERFGTKSGSPSLNRNDIHPLLVSIPNPNEQIEIARIIYNCDELLTTLSKELEKNKLQKTGLMQDLLTGKVRVTDLLNQKTAAN
ncbi:Type I restriction-modification system, specificity subunit S [Microcystis aeruginosa NIES-2549]|uniref:Type I restriction-modification system, specificity subunit S n=1 Tax=Microcystis aeruginosa NIES-2549 TaxID=1641812 RepID=A0A0F6U180_MICAE|nr:restriction endonuclease subunit S [Microcystis aeruginosa]AKE62774.1 Type I restriction-modification system, specificity subunit S [Microcystis aeruginosa NIES-2549]AOC51165.1 Type I restriction-modification system, specificity subunit S [Microcystis aeruginosa NIES-2481]